MLLVESRFKNFTKKQLVDPTTHTHGSPPTARGWLPVRAATETDRLSSAAGA